MVKQSLAALILAISLPVSASAQEADSGFALGFSARGGVQFGPEYFGSDNSETYFAPGISPRYLKLGRLELGSPDFEGPGNGFNIKPSFRVIGSRKAEDFSELTGLEDVDTAVELGLQLTYQAESWRAFGAVRQGLTGHDGLVGELGADVLFKPSDQLTIHAGPRAFFGDGNFADTYFGVTGDEAAASNFDEFDASGGLLSTGVEVGATYQFNENWELDGSVRFHKWQNDAADSPISESDSDVRATIGITRHFRLGF